MKPIVVSFFTPGPYERDAEQLRESCDAHGYEHDIVRVKDSGNWTANTCQKARVIRAAMAKHDRPLLWLDADGWIKQPMPLLDDMKTDLVLHIQKQNKPGWQAQRWRYQQAMWGGMWNSGIMLIRNTATNRTLLDAWAERCEQAPHVWDQINLQMAARELGVLATDLPAEYRAGGAHFGHRSGHHAHYGPRQPERNVLFIGSAPDAPAWWAEHGARYWRDGWSIVAINNAWLVPDECHLWLKPNDYKGQCPAFTPSNGGWVGPEFNRQGNWRIKPFWKHGKLRLSVTDALAHLLNEAVADRCRLTVHVVGCDMQYPKEGPTHFYGTGDPDPLRYTPAELGAVLGAIKTAYGSYGAKIYNAGGQPRTALPFDAC